MSPAVAATIGEQWETLGDDSARLLLRVASLFAESAALPIARLGLLADLDERSTVQDGFPRLRRTVKRLDDACLVERLEGDQVRLHPLIREFAAHQISPDQGDEFRRQCLERAVAALEHFPTLEVLDFQRGDGRPAGRPHRHSRALSPVDLRPRCSTPGCSPFAPA